MKLFVSKIAARFSIRGVAKELNMHHALTYRACRPLIKNKYLIPDGNQYTLNYKEYHPELAYIENLRTQVFLSENRTLELFARDMEDKFPYAYFVLCVFGSTVESSTPRDTDVLCIIKETENIEFAERALHNISKSYTSSIHSVVVSFESVYDMLSSRDEKNVMNEVLNKHLILYGGELFYRLIKKGRK